MSCRSLRFAFELNLPLNGNEVSFVHCCLLPFAEILHLLSSHSSKLKVTMDSVVLKVK